MFMILTVIDVIRIPPTLLSGIPAIQAIHSEIDQKYPNRILLDVGLVISRYGDCLSIGHGVCVNGDGGSIHEVKFRLLVFRPFVEEVVVGRILKSNNEGIQVSLGFFQDIFIPAYWMLRPSTYEEKTGLWVWIPQYDEDEEGEGEGEDEAAIEEKKELNGENSVTNGNQEVGEGGEAANGDGAAKDEGGDDDGEGGGENRYEMEIGSEIRFKVKSINFTQITNTAKGVQATTTTTAQTMANPLSLEHETSTGSGAGGGGTGAGGNTPTGTGDMTKPSLRRSRSSSVGAIDETQAMPAAMHIVASICEDGLGLTSWWTSPETEEEEEEGEEIEEGHGEEGEGDGVAETGDDGGGGDYYDEGYPEEEVYEE